MINNKIYLLNGVINVIANFIFAVLKYVYKFLKLLHLRLLAFFLLFSLFYQLITHNLTTNFTQLIIFITITALLFMRFVYLILDTYVLKPLFSGKKEKVKEKQQENVKVDEENVQNDDLSLSENVQEIEKPIIRKREKPKYYRVSQNPKYIMAEYSDRYELFFTVNGKMQYVRTDYKNRR